MKTAAVVAALVVAFFGAAALRAVREGRALLAAGDAAMSSGDTREAIADWEAAARWYVPHASHVDDARSRLAGLAGENLEAAWAARRAARTVGDEAPEADRAIARLAAADPDGALGAGPTRDARQAWHAALLARDPRPGTGASVLCALGILAFVGGVAWIVRRPGWAAAAISVGGIVAWAAGLYAA